MKRLLFMCLVFFLIAVGCKKEEKAPEEVAAVVNGEEITRTALTQAVLERYGGRTLEELIVEKLIQQEAKAQDISLTPAEKEVAFAQRVGQAGGLDSFQRALSAAGRTEESFREALFNQMLLRKISEKDLVITNEDIKEMYERAYGERRTLQEITITKVRPAESPAVREPLSSPYGTTEGPPESERGEEAISEELPEAAAEEEGPQAEAPVEEVETVRDARAEAEAILQELKGGADFTRMAVRRTEPLGTRARGGIIYQVPRGFLPPELEEVVFSLKEGEITRVLETEEAFHIIKVIFITPAQEVELKDKVEELREAVRQQRSEALAWDLVRRMQEDAVIERRFSPQ